MPVIYFPNIGHTVLGEQSCLVVLFGVRNIKNVGLKEKELNIFYRNKLVHLQNFAILWKQLIGRIKW